MKRRISRLFSFAMVLSVVFSVLAAGGCTRRTGVEINENMTQLWVQNFNGGFGSAWLDVAAERFSEMYADEEFEPGTGKKGVQIIIDNTKSLDEPDKSTYEVFFADDTDYLEGIASGDFLDITDMVKETLPGETKTIEDKLYDEQKEYLTSIDGEYYAIPHYERTSSLIYDIDLFENNKLYFAADRSEFDFILTNTQQKSAGPDGIPRTYDDGLPATVEEYKLLFDYMLAKNITPLIWTGAYVDYVNKLLATMSATLGGKKQYEVLYSLEGDVEIITDYDTLASKVESITKENGYLLAQRKSDYEALKFLEIVFSNEDYYHDLSISPSCEHLDAQEQFIYSSLENEPIAMLVESNYWLNEASDAIQRSINDYGERAENRRFGYMPLPTVYSGEVTEENAGKQTMVHLLDSFSFINSSIANNPNKIRLAKMFLQYCYTDEILLEFTKATNTFKPLYYPYEEVLDSLNSYAKTIYEVRKDADQVFRYTTDPIFRENTEVVPEFSSVVGNVKYTQPVDAFKKGCTAIEYFEGMQMDGEAWESKFSKYFD